jgi:hypothetical protein
MFAEDFPNPRKDTIKYRKVKVHQSGSTSIWLHQNIL